MTIAVQACRSELHRQRRAERPSSRKRSTISTGWPKTSPTPTGNCSRCCRKTARVCTSSPRATLTQVSNLVSDMQRFIAGLTRFVSLGRAGSGAAAVRRAAGGVPAAMTRPAARPLAPIGPERPRPRPGGLLGLVWRQRAAHLYRVTPKSSYPPNLPRRSVQLLIDVPLAPAGLDTARIALTRSAVSIDYFADSEWTDRAPLLVQTALLAILREQQGDHRDRPGIGRGCGRISSSRPRSGISRRCTIRPTGRPRSGWRSTSGSSIPPTARSSRRPRSSGVSSAAANDVPSIVAAFDEALGGGDEGHRGLDGHQSRFVGEARLAILDAFCSREVVGWRTRIATMACASAEPRSSG